MGLWDKAKEGLEKGREAVETAAYTQEFSEAEAEAIAEEMRHDVAPETLRRKKRGQAPLDRLDEGEQLLYLLKGMDFDIDDNDEGHSSQLMVTDKRLVIVVSSITSKTSMYNISYTDIIGVSLQQRLTTQVRIQTAGHSYKISVAGSLPSVAREMIEYVRRRTEEAKGTGSTDEAESSLDKLERLAALNEQGVVSDEEFEEKKAQLLDEI